MGPRRAWKRAVMTLIVGIGAVLASPSLAVASCIAPPPFPEAIEAAPAVFVGTVVDLSGRGRWATVDVSDVWSGGDLPGKVEVRGGPRRGDVRTSGERHFKLSREYLFVPWDRKGSVFLDNNCTRTTRFNSELTRFRPSSATDTSPTPEASLPELEKDAPISPWLLAGAVIVAFATIALVFVRRR